VIAISKDTPWEVDRVIKLLEFERLKSLDLKFDKIMAIAPKDSNLRKFDENEAPGIDLNIK
jgi:hypothetical protein